MGEESLYISKVPRQFSCECVSDAQVLYMDRTDIGQYFPSRERTWLIGNFFKTIRARMQKYLKDGVEKIYGRERKVEHIDYDTMIDIFGLVDDGERVIFENGFVWGRESGNKGHNLRKLAKSEESTLLA